jgi:hypothetical protein
VIQSVGLRLLPRLDDVVVLDTLQTPRNVASSATVIATRALKLAAARSEPCVSSAASLADSMGSTSTLAASLAARQKETMGILRRSNRRHSHGGGEKAFS